MAPKTLFDADFKYRSADMTDLRLTFARIRREMQRAEKRDQRADVAGAVLPMASSDDTEREAQMGPSHDKPLSTCSSFERNCET